MELNKFIEIVKKERLEQEEKRKVLYSQVYEKCGPTPFPWSEHREAHIKCIVANGWSYPYSTY